MRRIPLIAFVVALVLSALPLRGWSEEVNGPKGGRAARMTLRDGSSELVRLVGVGCDKALCSRVAINGRIQLDRLVAIRDVCDGRAQFVFRDGSEQSVNVVADNRVLYLTAQDGQIKKIHLHEVQSLTFASRESR